MKIPISILEASLSERRDNLKRYRSFKSDYKKQQKYFASLVDDCESEIASIEFAIEILLTHE